jgi:hypothetical protein
MPLAGPQNVNNRRSEQTRSATTANPITVCDGYGLDFVNVTGQILMAVHSCLPGDPDMAGSEAQHAHPCRSLSRLGDFCPWEEIWQQPRIQTGAA